MLPKKCVPHFRLRHLGPDGQGLNFALEPPRHEGRRWIERLVSIATCLPGNGKSLQAIHTAFYGNKPVEVFECNGDQPLVSARKDAIPCVVCADCPEDMKKPLMKYPRAEPTRGFNDPVKLGANYARAHK